MPGHLRLDLYDAQELIEQKDPKVVSDQKGAVQEVVFDETHSVSTDVDP